MTPDLRLFYNGYLPRILPCVFIILKRDQHEGTCAGCIRQFFFKTDIDKVLLEMVQQSSFCFRCLYNLYAIHGRIPSRAKILALRTSRLSTHNAHA